MTESIIGTEILGQFRIIERIGRGGMGEVFKAEQPAMDRLVAIKILHQKLAGRQDLLSRFRREARAMSRLTHPNTVRVFLYGHLEETGQLYIAMEYLDGVDLARITQREGPMDPVRATRILIQVLGALEEAHSVGVIHRDLKPENILLTTQGGIPDTPKVLDFGLAKIRDEKLRPGSLILTREGMVFGTPEFMSPEQARGETLDARSDIYSAGVIFYEMLTGMLPFPRCKSMEYIAHHIKTPPIPVTECRPELNIPSQLDAIIGRSLEKDRTQRYQTAAEFSQALESVLPREDPSVSTTVPLDPSSNRGIRSLQHASSSPASMLSGRLVVMVLLLIIVALLGVVAFLLLSDKTEGSPPVQMEETTISGIDDVDAHRTGEDSVLIARKGSHLQ